MIFLFSSSWNVGANICYHTFLRMRLLLFYYPNSEFVQCLITLLYLSITFTERVKYYFKIYILARKAVMSITQTMGTILFFWINYIFFDFLAFWDILKAYILDWNQTKTLVLLSLSMNNLNISSIVNTIIFPSLLMSSLL